MGFPVGPSVGLGVGYLVGAESSKIVETVEGKAHVSDDNHSDGNNELEITQRQKICNFYLRRVG